MPTKGLNTCTYLIGKRFGKLAVLGPDEPGTRPRNSYWVCQCDCGAITSIRQSGLTSTKTKSCGCMMGRRYNPKTLTSKLAWEGWPIAKVKRFDEYQTRAKLKGLAWEITPELFTTITSSNCYYCNAVPSNIAHRSRRYLYKDPRAGDNFVYNGIDRVDNCQGYILNNIVACCKTCNYAKNNLPVNEFLSWVDRIYNHQHQSYIKSV